MDQLQAHQRAIDGFAAVLDAVGADQIDAPSPCEGWSVRDVVAHVIDGNHRMAGTTPPSPAELATRDDLARAFAESARAAQESFAAPDGLTRTIDMRLGTLPARVVIGMRTTDLLVHAWDLARATGQPTDIDPELAEEAWTAAQTRVTDDLRGPGRPFGPAQPCGESRPMSDRLAAFLGRDVA